MGPTHAVVFVLSTRLLPDADRCIQYCIKSGYDMIGLIRDNWREAMEYLADGRAEVLVIADERPLPTDRAPRIEVVCHQRAAGVRETRTRMLKPPDQGEEA